MNIKELHRQAILFVKEANVFFDKGDIVKYQELIEEAYILEKAAAIQLSDKFDNEPTRSVLYRSAANLAYILNEYQEAYDLIIEALKGKPFEELKIELGALLSDVLYKMQNQNSLLGKQFYNNGYLLSLRQESVPIKLEEKNGKYGGGFVISHLIDFLKNLQLSYVNYAEVNFDKVLGNLNLKNFDILKSEFLSSCNLIGVNLNFRSFGVDVVAEKSFMNPLDINSPGFLDMKQNLFSSFKEDVLFPEYNDEHFQKEISNKFNEEERKKIFSPIVSSLSNSKKYSISITNKNYSKKVKEFKPLNNSAKMVFKPKVEIVSEAVNISLTKKIEQTIGNKKKIIVNEQLKNAEFEITLNDIFIDKKKVSFIQEHIIVIVFNSSLFSISDDLYNIDVSNNDYDKIIDSYSKLFIDNYSNLINNKEDLSDDERELLRIYESSTIRDW